LTRQHAGGRWTRRAALQGCAVAAATGSTAFAAQRSALNVPTSDLAFNVRTIGKLQGDLSGKPTYTLNPGCVYGIVPGQSRAPNDFAQLLFKVIGCTKRISRLLPDGSVAEKSLNWMYYLDAVSEAPLDEWRNPYTNERLAAPPLRGGPAESRLTTRGPVTASFPGLESTALDAPLRVDWRLLGETAWISRHSAQRIPVKNEPSRNEFSIDAWVCKIADVLNERLTHIPASYCWTSHAEWPRWLKMPRYPGHVLWRIESSVVAEREELPNAFVAELERRAPGALATPLSW
jgi:hypothetical protein